MVRHHDGELPPDWRSAIDAHLEVCESCRREYYRIGRAVTACHDDESAGAALAGILDRIQVWSNRRAQPGSDDEVRRRVESEVAPYLGASAAGQVLRSVSFDGANLLSALEPLLTMFLGRRAASALMSHIIDDTLVRIL